MHLSAIGHTVIPAHAPYPPGNHPAGRAFSWNKGRIIQALQLVAIREGRGEIEWMREKQSIRPGTVFILKPGDWHRYRPRSGTGWTEDWLEIRGHLADHWLEAGLFENRFYKLQEPKRFFQDFDQIHEAVQTTGMMPDGYLESRALGLVAALQIARSLPGKQTLRPGERERIAQARRLLTEGMEVHRIAEQLKVSYQNLYRSFKQITGLSPKQFAESGRLARAEGLLGGDQLTIKEIADMLDYNSASHFSLAFKGKYGLSPNAWREQLNQTSKISQNRSNTDPAELGTAYLR